MLRKKYIIGLILTLGLQTSLAQQFQITCSNIDVCYPMTSIISIVSPQAGYTYQWYLANSGTPCASGQAIQVTTGFLLSASISGQYYCIGFSGAGNIYSNSVYVRVLPGTGPNHLPAPGINAGNTLCVNSASLCIPMILWSFNFPVTVSWYRDNVQIPGVTGGNYTATQTGYYKYSIYNVCLSMSDSTYVSILPSASVTASSSTTLCPGGSVTLNVNAVQGTTYQWKKDTINMNGATANSYLALIAGQYTCVTTNGCGSITSNIVTVTQLQNPPSSISTNAPLTFCQGLSFSVNADTGNGPGLSYQWKKNAVIINGANASSYLIKTSGSYTCQISNACGSNTSNALAFTVIPAPGASVTANGPTTFCQGGSVLLNTTTGPNRTYQWFRSGNYISGATASSYLATAAGTYKVNVYNPVTDCSKKTVNGVVVAISANVDSVSPKGPITICTGDSVVLQTNYNVNYTYQWKNGSNIAGATSNSYTAKVAGNYKVKITKNNGCIEISNAVTVYVPCKENEIPVEEITTPQAEIFPNPTSGAITLHFENMPAGINEFIITNVLGEVILKQTTSEETVLIDISLLTPGVYFITIPNSKGQFFKKTFQVQN